MVEKKRLKVAPHIEVVRTKQVNGERLVAVDKDRQTAVLPVDPVQQVEPLLR